MNPNNYENQKLRGLKRKYEAILVRGGKCEKCGYNKNIAALDFHHINPSEKSYQLDGRHLSNCSMKSIIEESKKCILLCANCHREIHYPFFDKNDVVNVKTTVKSIKEPVHKQSI